MSIRFGLLSLAGPPTNGVSEVQRLTITGTPAGGTLTMTFGGQTTTDIPRNATATQVQNALEVLSTIGSGNVSCSVGPLPGTAVDITFAGDLAGLNVAALTTTDSLTGGTNPASAISTPTSGVKGTFRSVNPGCYLQDTVNGILYMNTGTANVPVWTAQ